MASLFTDEDYEKPWQELSLRLTARVKKLFDQYMDTLAFGFLTAINECESPIEQLFAMALHDYETKCSFMADDGCYVVNPQYNIQVSDKNFRADFLICAIYQGKEYKVVVECDGHNFHEKTKEQAARDKKRDRDLTSSGYTVMRFTGSEIHKNPSVCVRETLSAIFPVYRR